MREGAREHFINRSKVNSSYPLPLKQKKILFSHFSKIMFMSGRGPTHAQPHKCTYVCRPVTPQAVPTANRPSSLHSGEDFCLTSPNGLLTALLNFSCDVRMNYPELRAEDVSRHPAKALNIVFHRRGGEALVNLGQEVCEL